jgi:hypothetical protein
MLLTTSPILFILQGKEEKILSALKELRMEQPLHVFGIFNFHTYIH